MGRSFRGARRLVAELSCCCCSDGGTPLGLRQVPSEAFRLGRTRVFFKAGQISTLQRILNETGPEKAPWVLKRLEEALANRLRAKEAAADAEVSRSAPSSVGPAPSLTLAAEAREQPVS